jgi:hypothetical protein
VTARATRSHRLVNWCHDRSRARLGRGGRWVARTFGCHGKVGVTHSWHASVGRRCTNGRRRCVARYGAGARGSPARCRSARDRWIRVRRTGDLEISRGRSEPDGGTSLFSRTTIANVLDRVLITVARAPSSSLDLRCKETAMRQAAAQAMTAPRMTTATSCGSEAGTCPPPTTSSRVEVNTPSSYHQCQ